MSRQQLYDDRLKELGLTRYQLVQRIVELRQSRGEDITFKSIQTSIYKALDEPDGKSAKTNDDIITALGGEVIIRWTKHEEVKL